MAIDQKRFEHSQRSLTRDIRPMSVKIGDALQETSYSSVVFIIAGVAIFINDWALAFGDVILLFMGLFFWWLSTRDRSLPFKLPLGSTLKDQNNMGPGKSGQAEGILYVGNKDDTNEEIWFSNSDARTHILYLGTTGAGKTVGLTSLVTNTLAWGSGFVYVDGKADTDLWSSLSSLVRRFGRDDDLLVLNYMTGNSDVKAPSNTMNPFSSGSASYITNMLVSLMPESSGDNAMWSQRAISLVSAMMPVLTWKRDHQEYPLSVRVLRDNLSLNNVIKLSRDDAVPVRIREGMKGYLDTLPGYDANAFDDNGKVKPPDGGGPPPDTQTASQQHGYLAMQFTRSLQSLGDDYGYIFDTQAADVDMVDVVLNRRILVVLIPALEKSGDEIANLGKIVAATMKGMMGSALGSTVEGSSETVIENKATHSSTPFMTVFDEVGYYTAEGMAVMAAQARSLGFCLVFSGQDLPAMKKRVREEANSITANCNLKIFGKLEDPTETKEFFEKTVGTAFVTEVSSFQSGSGSNYADTKQASVTERAKASYGALRNFKEGEAVVTFGSAVIDAKIFYSNPGHAKAMRVTRFMALPPPKDEDLKHAAAITKVRDIMVDKGWTAAKAEVAAEIPPEIDALKEGFFIGDKADHNPVNAAIASVVQIHAMDHPLEAKAMDTATPAEAPQVPQAPQTTAKTEAEPTQTASTKEPAQPTEQDSQKWRDIISKAQDKPAETTQTTPAEPVAAKPPEKPKAKLPDEILKIIDEAGTKARNNLFKNKEDQ